MQLADKPESAQSGAPLSVQAPEIHGGKERSLVGECRVHFDHADTSNARFQMTLQRPIMFLMFGCECSFPGETGVFRKLILLSPGRSLTVGLLPLPAGMMAIISVTTLLSEQARPYSRCSLREQHAMFAERTTTLISQGL